MKVRVWLPIERRELLVFSRQAATYFRRLLTPLAVLGVTFLFTGGRGNLLDPHDKGLVIFLCLAWIAFAYALLSGFILTSDCLSKEKREQTLGLLFLTDLRSRDIVLGKLLSHSLVAVSGLVATLPLLMLPVLLGGIAFRHVWQMALTLLITLLLSLAVGLFASSLFRDRRLAVSLAICLMILLCLGGFMLEITTTSPWDPDTSQFLHQTVQGLKMCSPLFFITLVSDDMVGTRFLLGSSQPLWPWTALVQTGLAALLIVAACYFTGRLWQERSTRQFSLGQRLRHWLLFGPAWYRRRVHRQWFDRDPLVWMIVRPWYKTIVIWSLVVIFASFFALALWLTERNMDHDFLWLAWMALGLFKFALALESAQGLAHEIRQEELESLLGTPLRNGEYIASHWKSLQVLFVRPLVALVALVLVMSCFEGHAASRNLDLLPNSEPWLTWLVYGGLLFMALLDCWALAWVGLWQGLSSRRQLHSGLRTTFLILGVPWILAAGSYLALLWMAYRHQQPLPEGQAVHVLLLLFSVPTSIVLGRHGRQQVKQKFRTLALQHRHGEAPLPWWKNLLSLLPKAAKPSPQTCTSTTHGSR